MLKILLISKLYFYDETEKQKAGKKTTATFRASATSLAVQSRAKVLDWEEKVPGTTIKQVHEVERPVVCFTNGPGQGELLPNFFLRT